jgi:hypothetical protein
MIYMYSKRLKNKTLNSSRRSAKHQTVAAIRTGNFGRFEAIKRSGGWSAEALL